MLSPLFPKPTQGHQPFLNASFNLSYQIRYNINRKLKRTGFCALTMNTSFLNCRQTQLQNILHAMKVNPRAQIRLADSMQQKLGDP